MLKPVGLTHGHYECRLLAETLPVLTMENSSFLLVSGFKQMNIARR